MKFKLLALFFFITSLCFGQTTLDFDQRFQDMMKQQRDLIDSVMKDEKEFNQQMEKLFERLQKQGAFGGLNQRLFQFRNSYVKSKWVDDKDKMKLVLDLNPKEDKVNIDISSGVISVKGKEKVMNKFKGAKDSYSYSLHNFQQSFSIPKNVDHSSANFKSEDGKIVIEFNKLTTKKVPLKNFKSKKKAI